MSVPRNRSYSIYKTILIGSKYPKIVVFDFKNKMTGTYTKADMWKGSSLNCRCRTSQSAILFYPLYRLGNHDNRAFSFWEEKKHSCKMKLSRNDLTWISNQNHCPRSRPEPTFPHVHSWNEPDMTSDFVIKISSKDASNAFTWRLVFSDHKNS